MDQVYPVIPKLKIKNTKSINNKLYLNKPYNRQAMAGFRNNCRTKLKNTCTDMKLSIHMDPKSKNLKGAWYWGMSRERMLYAAISPWQAEKSSDLKPIGLVWSGRYFGRHAEPAQKIRFFWLLWKKSTLNCPVSSWKVIWSMNDLKITYKRG